jgi:hypothetical protein
MFGEEFLQDFRRKRPAAFIDLMIAFESRHAPPSPPPPTFSTVARTTQNEAVLWRNAGLGMKKAPVGSGTF